MLIVFYAFLLCITVLINVVNSSENLAGNSAVNKQRDQEQIKKEIYVCPMHSHVLSDKEGRCPICGMDLVLMKENSEEKKQNTKSPDYAVVNLVPGMQERLAIKTQRVKRGDLKHTIETIGKITRIDPMSRRRITSPISGRIVDMNKKYSGDIIKKEEFLFSVASEELFKNESDFVTFFSRKDKSNASHLMTKLIHSGLDAGDISRLQQGASPNIPVRIYSKEDGYIYAKRGKISDKINNSFTVFNLGGNYQVVEITAEIFERQWNLVKEGQKVRIRLRNLPGVLFNGIVERVDDPVGYTTRALEVRIKFKSDREDLTQSTFARVFIEGRTKHNVLLVPRDAVIKTADSAHIVKVLSDFNLQPVEIIAGEESDGQMEILSGLQEGDRIVTSGQFLIDSESNILSALARMERNEIKNNELKNNIDSKMDH